MLASLRMRNRAFSLIELVVVVVILGIIGAIAIPRMSRGASGAADSALVADLAVLRNAIALYETEHQGAFPKLATFTAQLTQYSDVDGATSATKTGAYIYGPYLRAVPKLKVGSNKGSGAVAGTGGGSEGWLYNESTGEISANLPSTETDAAGTPYADY
ncbi:MAG: prepilin-type N-terminal cleavage/methylation domain-containing protein [Phycisphaerales bacterium]|nr:prepilin-type N-terminal cleavage/methylation domain-containing protein [Phycisphaerales bacterium]